MPILESLVVGKYLGGGGQDEEHFLPDKPVQIFQQGAPLLTYFCLDGISINSCKAPVGRLTRLDIIAD